MNEKILKLEEKLKVNIQKKSDYQEKIKKLDEESEKIENQITQLKATEVLYLLEVNHIDLKDLKGILDNHKRSKQNDNKPNNQNKIDNINQNYNNNQFNKNNNQNIQRYNNVNNQNERSFNNIDKN